ncbi:Glycosyltransferase [Rhodovulum sp. PH10]|uniref:glycosyltransferase family 4 protein n=1 Tax=Rhodovulum sp. PH10 TaxID=1187851 RepID=UPI00027C20A4|nr:glycosyltransferase family 4 protein [Rhodovulum sp. PH10]EJW10333.1 Glycosyltransferase [Rhodovulum sp. PH10]
MPLRQGEPLRVLQILHTDERGGILTLASALERGLAAHGIGVDTEILFSRPGLGAVAKARAAAAMAARLRRDDHDAVIAYQATASILVGLFAGRRGGRRIVHQTAIPGATARPLRIADMLVGTAGRYDANIANTVFTRDEFRAYPARYRRSLILIEHGVEPLRPVSDRATTRRRFGLPLEAPVVLTVGRPTPQKNQGVLIEALPGLGDAVLAVAGAGSDETALRAAAALGVGSRVRFLGALAPEDVADLYGACDLFAFPSVWETFGLAAVEAAMAGCPMVVSDLPVLREVLGQPAAPVVHLPPFDVAAWTAAIRTGLAAPPPRAARDAFAAALCRRYSPADMIRRYVALLRTGRADLAAVPAIEPETTP